MKYTWWFNTLNLPTKPRKNFDRYLSEELEELSLANGFWERMSEKADIVYLAHRAHWHGYADVVCPLGKSDQITTVPYMLLKHSSRWLFYRRAGHKLDNNVHICSVRNPKKTEKLERVARQWGLDENEFIAVCQKQLRYWVLLP